MYIMVNLNIVAGVAQ